MMIVTPPKSTILNPNKNGALAQIFLLFKQVEGACAAVHRNAAGTKDLVVNHRLPSFLGFVMWWSPILAYITKTSLKLSKMHIFHFELPKFE